MNDENLDEGQNKNLDGTAISTPSVEMTAPPVTTAPTYSEEEMRGHVANGTDYTLDQVNAMSDDQYKLYSRIADEASGKKKLSDRLALSDKLEKMTKFIADETDGDDGYKAVHDEAVASNEMLANNKTAFAKLSDEDVKWFADDIQKKYEEASKRRGHLDVAWDALKRGHSSLMNMLVQGYEALKPGEMSQEDSDIVKGAQKNANEDEILAPKKIGGVENIHSAGDAIDYFLETVGENTERMAIGAAGATLGAIAAPAIGIPAGVGAMVLGGASTLLGNTGEAVSDQLEENRDDGDIRKSRAYAIAQGIGYSILDGAFGVNKFAGRIWGSLLRRAGLKAAAKGASVEAAKSMYEKATLKGIAKEIGKDAILGEGLQEMAQSQGVGRGVRYFQTGSIFRKDENGNYETPGDAFLEAVNEFAGGATAGLTFGLLGGASAHADARRASRISHETNAILKDDKDYQQLPEYAKLLVDRRLQNDRYLATTNLITDDVRKSLEDSNDDIDREIDNLSKNGTDEEKIAAQSAKAYLDIFKSQYSLEEIDNIFGFDNKTGEYLSRDGKRYTSSVDPAAMLNNGEERVYEDGRGAIVYKNKTPGSEISVGELIGADGKPTGKYMVQNDPHFKTPIGGDGDYIFDSRDKAFEAARRLDAYNQWREDRLRSKAELANQVFTKLFGSRGVNLEFVDRPTDHKYINAFTSAAFVPNPKDENGNLLPPTVFLDLGKIDSLGTLYTTLVHERSHEDIVDFLMKSGKFYVKKGEKVVPDWEAVEAARRELMAKVQDENGQTAEQVSKKNRNADGTAKNEWGKSAAIAGEEMVAERNSVFELAKQLRDMERGVLGSVEDKIRQAIGFRMAYEMGVDPSVIMPGDVSKEMQKIFDLGYIGEPAPAEFQRETPTWNGQPVDRKATKRGQLRKTIGPQVAQTANGEGEIVLGTESDEGTPAAKPKALKPQMKAGGGVGYADNANIRRADGATFTKVGTSDGSYAWKNLDTNELVGDEAATEGGYEEIYDENAAETREKAPESAPGEEDATTPAPSAKPAEAKEAASEAKETPAKPKEEPKPAQKAEEKPKSSTKAEESPIDYTGWEKNHAKDVVDIIRGLPEGEKKEELKKAAYYGAPDASLKERIGEEKPKKEAPKAKKAKKEKEPEVWTKKQPPKAVAKTETPAPTAEKKSEVAAPAKSDEKASLSAPKETATTSRTEAAKTVEKQEARPAAKEEQEPARVNPDEDTLTVEQGKENGEAQSVNSEDEVTLGTESDNEETRRINKAIDETVDNIATFVNDAQRKAVKERAAEIGEPDNFRKSQKDGYVLVSFNGDEDILGPDGHWLTDDEIDDLYSEKPEEPNMARNKTIIPSVIRKLNAMTSTKVSSILDRGLERELKLAGQLSDDRVLKMAMQDGNMLAMRALWDRWTRSTKKHPSGAIQEWFLDKGVSDNEIGRWIGAAHRVFRRIVFESDILESWKDSAERSEKVISEIKENLKKNGVNYDEIGDLNPQKGTPLGRTVGANALLYGTLNLIWANNEMSKLKTKEQFDAERSEQVRRILEEEKAARKRRDRADKLYAREHGITIEEARRRRIKSQTVEVAEEYRDFVSAKSGDGMTDEEFANEKEVLSRCVSQDGKDPDENARRAVLVKASEMVSRLAGSSLGKYGLNNPSNVADVNEYVLDLIEKQWRKGSSSRSAFWSGKSESKKNNLESNVKKAINIRAMQLRDESFKNESLNAALPGNEYGSDDENGAATLEGMISSTATEAGRENEERREEEEYRRERGWFADAEEAVDEIINSGALPKLQSDVLLSLVNTWKARIADAEDELASAKNTGASQRRVANLEKKLKEMRKLGVTDSVISDAATAMNMKEAVYRGNLFGIFADIEKAMAGETVHIARKSGANMPDDFWRKSIRLSKGMFSKEDVVDSLSGLYDSIESALNYNVDNLIFAMRSNGDEMMAKAVEMARDGKTNKEIFDAFDKGEFGMIGNSYSIDADSASKSLEDAYERYGWIDTRVFGPRNDRADRVRMLQNVLRVFAGNKLFDSRRRNEYKAVQDVLNKWFEMFGIDINKEYGTVSSADLAKDDFEKVSAAYVDNDYDMSAARYDIKKENPLRYAEMMKNYEAKARLADDIIKAIDNNIREDEKPLKNRERRQGVKSDHAVVRQMMTDNGNDEAAVRRLLKESGNDDKRVERMFKHWRSEESKIAEKEKRAAAREAAKTAGILKGLSNDRKAEADSAFDDADGDISVALDSLEENGWNENQLKQARNYYDYKKQTASQTNEEVVAGMSFGQKSDLVKAMLAQTGDAYMTDEEVLNEAVEKYGMPKASVQMIIDNVRQDADVATEGDLAERASRIEEESGTRVVTGPDVLKGDSKSTDLDREAIAEAKDAVAKAEKELADLGKGAPGMFDRVNDRFKLGMSEDEAKADLRMEGLSDERIKTVFKKYEDVKKARENIDAAKDALAKVEERLAKDRGESSMARNKTITVTFDVNYGASNEDVTVSATSVKSLINKAIRKACNGQWYRYDSVQITPKSINGKPVSGFGIITADDSRNTKRSAALSKAFGFERSGEVPEADMAVHGNAEAGRGTAGVAGDNRREGFAEDRGSDVRGDRPGQAVNQEDWYTITGVEPHPDELDSGEISDLRNDFVRYKTLPGTNKSTGLSDPSAGFAAEESLEATGFGRGEGRQRKVRAVLDRQARDLIAKDPLMLETVSKIRNGGTPSDVEIAALNLRLRQMQDDAVKGNLDADLFQKNEENMETLVEAIRAGKSEAGAALQATQVGVDMRTLDMDVYMRAETKARFRKEIEKESGVGSVGEHEAELRKALEEKSGRIKEMSSELQTANDELDKAKAELAKVHAKAEDEEIERAYRRGIRQGEKQATEAEKKRRLDAVSNAVGKFGAIRERAGIGVDAADVIFDIFGAKTRFAGNPKAGLTDAMRNAFAGVLYMFDGDAEKARNYLSAKSVDADVFRKSIEPMFNAYLAEEEKAAKPKDGTVKEKKRIVKERIRKRAEESAPKKESSKTYLDRIQKRAEDAYTRAVMSDTEEQAMRATGEYAREMFRVLDYANPDRQTDELLDVLVSKMNELYGRFSNGEENERFDAQDAKDALLGKGSFAPVTKESAKVDLARLLKAQKLLDENRETEAAKEAGIRGVTDADILQELDRRIGSLLNTKLNRLEERIEAKDEDTAGLRKEIHDLIMALHDIRSGKPVGELLGKYLNLAIGMKDYRKQRTLREQIESRIAMYERKLKENDFESVPKVPVPDDRDELLKVADAQRHLEQKRERFKRERSMWRVRKGPFVSRVAGSIIELLGEVKAVAGSMDLSAVLRQGGQMTFAHPIMAYRSFKKTLEAFRSEKKANEIMDEIAHRPNYQYYLEAGIDFTDWGDNAASAEDMYILNKYRLITRNKLMKWGINASERAFVTYLNLMRANVFDAMVAASPMREAANFSKEQLLALGRFVNVASQRGAIDQSGKLGKALELANGILWSPRNIISRFQFIWNTLKLAIPGTKYYGISGDMEMRKAFAKETARYVTGVAIAIFFAKMMADLLRDDDEPPVDIVTDPKSSDFLKVKVGNTRIDFLSGLQQVMVFGSRMWAGEKTQGNGNTVKKDRGEMLARFARTKFSPAAGVIYDLFTREDFDKRDISFSPSEQLTKDKDTIGVTRYLAGSLFMPLIAGDVLEQAEDSIGRLPATFVLSALGAGVQTYDSGTYKAMKQDYQYFKRLWKAAETKEERDRLELYHPMLKRMGAIDNLIRSVNGLENKLRKAEKAGAKPSDLNDLKERIEIGRKQFLNQMSGQKKPMQVE